MLPAGMTLRVLHIDSGRDWRGGQRQVLLLANGLRELGYEPLVVAPPESPLLHRLRANGVAASAVRMRAEWDFAALRRIRALVRTWNADIVHAHDARAHGIAVGALVRRRSIPLVVTRRVPIPPRRARLKYGWRVTRFIAISQAVRDGLVEGGVDPGRIDVVYSGVPTPTPGPARDWRRECRWPEDTVLCGVVGAMTAEKGMHVLERIAAHLHPEARGRARLLLLGGTAAGSCNIGGVEAFRAGFVDEIHAAMRGLDVLWHPSSVEGLGTAVIDAMALGVPPIAFATGGLRELIMHGVSGILVPPGSHEAFASEGSRLISDVAARRALGEGGFARSRLFDVGRMVDGTEAVYRHVLAAKNPNVMSPLG